MIKWVREEEKMWQQSLKMTRLNRTFSVNKVERAPTKVLRCLPPMSISSPWIHTGKMIILLQANNLKWRKRMIHQQANLLNEKWKKSCVYQCIIFLIYMLQSQCNSNLHLRKHFTISAHFSQCNWLDKYWMPATMPNSSFLSFTGCAMRSCPIVSSCTRT